MRGEISLAVGRVRRAWRGLGESTTLDRPSPFGLAPLTPRRRVELDELVRDERDARLGALTGRTKPTGAQPAPARPSMLDARAAIDDVVVAYAPEVFTAHTGQTWAGWPSTSHERVTFGLDTLARYAPRLVDSHTVRLGMVTLLDDLVDALDVVARLGEQLAGLDPAIAPLRDRDCPACGLRTLRVRLDSPDVDEWVVECHNHECLCPELVGCPCDRPVRVAGRRHLWAMSEWGPLAARLGLRITGRVSTVTTCAMGAHDVMVFTTPATTGQRQT